MPAAPKGVLLTAAAALALTTSAAAQQAPGGPEARPADRPPDRQAPAQQPPRDTNISVVISVLRREVMDPRRRELTWPRDRSDFAVEKNWRVPPEQLLRALTRPLHRDPSMDAYIKWQLLSFEPDLDGLDEPTRRRLLAAIPNMLAQPEPQMRQSPTGTTMVFQQRTGLRGPQPIVGTGVVGFDPSTSVVAGGTGLGPAQRMTTVPIGPRINDDPQLLAERRRTEVRQVNYLLQQAREQTDLANVPVRAYRAALAEALPAEDGLRLGVMLSDVADRIAAGDPSHPEAMARLLEAVERQAKDGPAVASATKLRLIQWARQLGQIRATVVRSLAYDADGWAVNLADVVVAPEQDVEKLIELLRALPEQEEAAPPRQPQQGP